MKKIVLYCLVFMCAPSSFAADCAFDKNGSHVVKSWTGSCEAGIVSGDGKGVYSGKFGRKEKYEQLFVGKFVGENGNAEFGTQGPSYTLQEGKFSSKYNHYLYFSSNPSLNSLHDMDDNNLPFTFVAYSDSSKLSRTTRFNQMFTQADKTLSFDEVIEKLYKRSSSKNIPSMDKEKFLSLLLEEEYKKEQLAKEVMRDDPPVAGIRLSLGGGGDSSVKTKKKSKKKN